MLVDARRICHLGWSAREARRGEAGSSTSYIYDVIIKRNIKVKHRKAVDIRLGVVPETESRLLQCIVHCVCHGDSGSRRAYLKRFID
jgi:hypothetical protein